MNILKILPNKEITKDWLTDRNAKIEKSKELGYYTSALHLAPAKISGYEVCAGRSDGCTLACNNTSGRGKFTEAQIARILKTRYLMENRKEALAIIDKNIQSHITRSENLGLIPALRLNCTSDLPWESKSFGAFYQKYPQLVGYDYTAILKRCKPDSKARAIPNYTLVFSRKENNWKQCLKALEYGVNVSVVFELDPDGNLPATFEGLPVVNGDDHDLIFLHKHPCIIGLRYKVPVKTRTRSSLKLLTRDYSGFTVLYNEDKDRWIDPQTDRGLVQSLGLY